MRVLFFKTLKASHLKERQSSLPVFLDSQPAGLNLEKDIGYGLSPCQKHRRLEDNSHVGQGTPHGDPCHLNRSFCWRKKPGRELQQRSFTTTAPTYHGDK